MTLKIKPKFKIGDCVIFSYYLNNVIVDNQKVYEISRILKGELTENDKEWNYFLERGNRWYKEHELLKVK